MIRNIVALLLIILPIDTFIFRIFSDNSYLYLLGYTPIIIGCVMYMLDFNKKSLIKKILSVFAIACTLISIAAITNFYITELERFGLLVGLIFFIGARLVIKVTAVILLAIDNKKYFFKNFWGSVLSCVIMYCISTFLCTILL